MNASQVNKLCSECKSEFKCGSKDKKCWCFDMPVVKKLNQSECLSKRSLMEKIKWEQK